MIEMCLAFGQYAEIEEIDMSTMNRRASSVILTMILLGALLTSCLAHPMASIPNTLVGTWHGESDIRLPIVFVPEPDDDPTNDIIVPVGVEIAIHDDGTVTGMVGGAELRDCVLKQNRGELGRSLNIATDFIIMDGYLDGPIVPEDTVLQKDLTIPFNIVDEQLKGTLFWTMEWKYPLPLMPRIALVKAE